MAAANDMQHSFVRVILLLVAFDYAVYGPSSAVKLSDQQVKNVKLTLAVMLHAYCVYMSTLRGCTQ